MLQLRIYYSSHHITSHHITSQGRSRGLQAAVRHALLRCGDCGAMPRRRALISVSCR